MVKRQWYSSGTLSGCRIMAVSSFPLLSNSSRLSHCLILGMSDSTMQLLAYEEETNAITVLTEAEHHVGPVLSLQYRAQRLTGGETRHLILSGSTDGVIAFWDVSAVLQNYADELDGQLTIAAAEEEEAAPLTPFFTLDSVHQSGVNCISAQVLMSGDVVVASGGDDQSVQVSLLQAQDLRPLGRVHLPFAHAAAVTGTQPLRPQKDGTAR